MKQQNSQVWWWSSVDIAIAATATVASLLLRHLTHPTSALTEALAQRLSLKNFLLLSFFLIVWTGIHQLCGLYGKFWGVAKSSLLIRALSASALGSVFFFLFPLFSNNGSVSVFTPVLLFFFVASVESLFVRWVFWPILPRLRNANGRPIRTILVGSGPLALRLYNFLSDTGISQHEVLGLVDSPGPHTDPSLADSVIATLTELESILMTTAVDEVAIALPLRSCYDAMQTAITICERIGVSITYHFQPFQHKIGISYWEERAFQPCLAWRPSSVEEWNASKRILDFAAASVALLFLSPVFCIIALLIKLTSPGPVFFIQERYGLNKQRFPMYKFRTMVSNAEALQANLESQNEAQGPVFKIKNDPRVTPLGRFLRKTSLDELPQLFNVLKGDMSLVGPRPLPSRDVAKFQDSWLMRRFSVKPGLTCLWQVKGRSSTTFDQWIAYDLEYIDNWSPLLDCKILLMTIPAVIRGNGAA